MVTTRSFRLRLTAGLLGIGIAVSVSPAVGAAADPAPERQAACPEASLQVEDLTAVPAVACDLAGTEVELPNGSAARVPLAGKTVTASFVYAQASADAYGEVTVANEGTAGVAVRLVPIGGQGRALEFGHADALTRLDESTTEVSARAATASTTAAAAIPSACSDTRYSTSGTKFASTYQWRYNSTNQTAPSGLARAQDAVSTVAVGITRCNQVLSNGATQTYLGTTGLSPDIDLNGFCNAADGTNTIGWGTLPGGTLMVTCFWSSGGITSEADTKINKVFSWFSGSTPSDCSGTKYDIQGVLTHEMGHAFGLDHVYSSNLVMKPNPGLCDTDMRRLGLGDGLGLQALYG